MPPHIRSEAPDNQDARIHKHLLTAGEYWAKCPIYFAEDDLRQAGEQAWGAVEQLTIAVATLRGWEHYDYVAVWEAVQAVANEMPDLAEPVYLGLNAAVSLYGNLYAGRLDRNHTEFILSTIAPLLNILWEQLPGEYTGGVSFGEWVDRAAGAAA